MQINSFGRAIGGVGQSGVYIDPPIQDWHANSQSFSPRAQILPPPNGQAAWWNNDIALYQTGDGQLWQVDVNTGRTAFLDGAGVTLARGANDAYGVWLSGQGVRFSWGEWKSGLKGVLGAADDGTIFCISDDYTAIFGYTPHSTSVENNAYPVIYYPAPQFSCLDANRWLWWNAQTGQINTRGLGNPPVQTWGTPIDPFVVETLTGELLIGYHSDKFYLHPISDKSTGYVVATGLTFYTCGRTVAQGRVLCAWSENQGETVLRSVLIDPSSPRVDLRPPTPEPDPIIVIGRNVWQGWIEFGATTGAPRNCYLTVPPIGTVPPPGFRAYVRDLHTGTNLFRYVAAANDSDVDALEAAIAKAKTEEPSMPVIAYWTLQAQGIRVPAGADAVLVEGYWKVGETLPALEHRIRANMARHPHPWIAAQCYTSNNSNQTDLRQVVPVYARILHDMGDGCLGFSDGNRQKGYADHPEVHQDWWTLNAGIPGTPPLPGPGPNPDPEDPMDIPYGTKIQVRKHDPSSEERPGQPRPDFMKLVVVKHGRDETYLDKNPDGTQTKIYGVSANFPSGDKRYITWQGSSDPHPGEIAGYSDDPNGPGGSERVTFDGKFMIVRPGCGTNGAGVAVLYDMVRL